MTKIFDVPINELINETAKELEKIIKQPEWSNYVKTSVARERAPDQKNYWFLRAASILRKVYLKGPIGVQRLRNYYGGKQNRGVKPNKFKKGSGKIIRVILQQLEEQGMIQKTKTGKKGRIITKKGTSFLDKISNAVAKKTKNKIKETQNQGKETKQKPENKTIIKSKTNNAKRKKNGQS